MRSASWQSFGRSAGGAGYGVPFGRYRSRRARRGTPARARIRSIVRGSGSSRSRSLLSSQRIAVAPTWAHGFAWSRRRTAMMSASSFGALRLALCLWARERSRAQPSSFGSYRASHFTTQRRLRRSSRATALALSPASTRRTASRRSFSSTSTIPVTSLDVRVEEERQRSGRSRVIESVDRSETQHEHDVLSVVRERCPDGCQLAWLAGTSAPNVDGNELAEAISNVWKQRRDGNSLGGLGWPARLRHPAAATSARGPAGPSRSMRGPVQPRVPHASALV